VLIHTSANNYSSPEDLDKELVAVELTKNVLEHLHLLFSEVISPVIQFKDNQVGWSDLVTKDLMERFNAYVAQVYVMMGLTKGRTMLPLPSKKMINSEGPEKDKAHIFEMSIMTWTKQIKNILKQEPEQALKAGNNPGPNVEIEFWENKAANLNLIYDQLQSIEVRNILRFLERSKSTYTNPFTKLQKEVQQARIEANDNQCFLSTLKEFFDKFKDPSFEFIRLQEIFAPMMHNIYLIYRHSGFYKTPTRLVVLIREICNAIITKAYDYINGEMVSSMIGSQETSEACERLQNTIDIGIKFKEAYFEYKAKSNGEWKLTLNALFVRLDLFIERCHDIFHLTSTILQFNKLERIELGGTKGATLTDTIRQIHAEFQTAVDAYKGLPYDTMDINEKSFDDDFYNFRNKIKELERRLASVITQGFDDNDTLTGKFRLLESFEIILSRPIIQDELEKKHSLLL
jgi:dynein heavy chain